MIGTTNVSLEAPPAPPQRQRRPQLLLAPVLLRSSLFQLALLHHLVAQLLAGLVRVLPFCQTITGSVQLLRRTSISTCNPPPLVRKPIPYPESHRILSTVLTPPKGTASDAVMNDASTAGQFNIVNGQLVQLINTSGTLLYAHVTLRADSTVNKLLVTWQTTPDTYGTFGFQGSSWLASLL